MCKICTGEIKNDTMNITIFRCKEITSEKLQLFLNKCTRLQKLQCHLCPLITCITIPSTIYKTLQCISLWEIPVTFIDTSKCINLTDFIAVDSQLISIDLRKNKKIEFINLSQSSSLKSINLTGIVGFSYITFLHCDNCRLLTSLLMNDEYYQYINYSKCPWITQNKDFSSNLQNLVKLQRWYRKLVIIKYMKSQEFIEWIYSPNNIGGKCCKKKLLDELTKKN